MEEVARHKSLLAQKNQFSESNYQLELLKKNGFRSFESNLIEIGLLPLKPTSLEVLQINLGKMCNQVCKHCHVDAGPDRKEIMSRDLLEKCLEILDHSDFHTVDLTGGAPEMNPHFRWFVEELSKREKHILVRCNLTIILANPKYNDLPEFFKTHRVEVVSSLPYFTAIKTDSQRGQGVFGKSIEALKMLNDVGYGKQASGLKLNLVYNPSGAFLPPDQSELEGQYKDRLKERFGIEFNELFTITNIPISRYLQYLVSSGNYHGYMEKLVNAFNPHAAANVMCRSMISVGWDGKLYDCDFNQMLDLKVDVDSDHLDRFNLESLLNRNIILNQHCYGCTAGSGSSCGGEIV